MAKQHEGNGGTGNGGALFQPIDRPALQLHLALELGIVLDVHLAHEVLLPLFEETRWHSKPPVFCHLQDEHVVDDGVEDCPRELFLPLAPLFLRPRRPELLARRLDFLVAPIPLVRKRNPTVQTLPEITRRPTPISSPLFFRALGA